MDDDAELTDRLDSLQTYIVVRISDKHFEDDSEGKIALQSRQPRDFHREGMEWRAMSRRLLFLRASIRLPWTTSPRLALVLPREHDSDPNFQPMSFSSGRALVRIDASTSLGDTC